MMKLFISRIVDINGNEMKFEYKDGLLTVIRDPVGKEFFFKYDEMNRIVSLEEKIGGRSISYHYGDNGDLEEVDLNLSPDLVAGTDYRYIGPHHVL